MFYPLLNYELSFIFATMKKAVADFNTYITQFDYSWLIDFMEQNGTLVQYRRNEPFCVAGKSCKALGYIRSGAFVYAAYDTEANRHVVGYAFENSFVGDYATFRLKGPANVDINALYDSEVYVLTIEKFNQFITQHPDIREQLLRITEILYSEIYRRLIAAYTRTAEERYTEIQHRCPDIFHHTTAKDLASYLQITPETLSRIRRKMKEQ